MNRHTWIESLDLKGIGAEIGVQSGNYSKVILDFSKLHLVLIDAWRHLDDYPDKANTSTANHLTLMNNTLKTLMPAHEGRFTLIRELSIVAAGLFPDNFFDFLYLDANHSRKAVEEDLMTWWPKVKTGGVIGGHDYLDLEDEVNSFGVKSAVDKFFLKKNIAVAVIDPPFPTWYTYKR